MNVAKRTASLFTWWMLITALLLELVLRASSTESGELRTFIEVLVGVWWIAAIGMGMQMSRMLEGFEQKIRF